MSRIFKSKARHLGSASALLVVVSIGVAPVLCSCTESSACAAGTSCEESHSARIEAGSPDVDAGESSSSGGGPSLVSGRDAASFSVTGHRNDAGDASPQPPEGADGSPDAGGVIDAQAVRTPRILVGAEPVVHVRLGATAGIHVTVMDGLMGPVELTVAGLPGGVTSETVTLAAAQESAVVTLTASVGAAVGRPTILTVAARSLDDSRALGFAYPKLWVTGAPGENDLTFGDHGVVQRVVTNRTYDAPNAAAIDETGRITLVGAGEDGKQPWAGWAVRLKPTGDLDPTFGSDGVVTNFGTPGSELSAVSLAGSSVVVAANVLGTSVQSYVRRLLDSGSPDPRFGNAGDAPEGSARIDDLLATRSGFIVRLGSVLRTLDADGNATSYTPLAGIAPYRIAIDSHDRIAYAQGSSAGSFTVGRLTPTGAADTSFGKNGPPTFPVPAGYKDPTPRTLMIDASDRIIAFGDSRPNGADIYSKQVALVRFAEDGVLQPGFGQNGTAIVSSRGFALNAFMQNDGRIVALFGRGAPNPSSNPDCAVARFDPEGTPDGTWGHQGVVTLGECPSWIAYDEQAERVLIVGADSGTGVKITRLWL